MYRRAGTPFPTVHLPGWPGVGWFRGPKGQHWLGCFKTPPCGDQGDAAYAKRRFSRRIPQSALVLADCGRLAGSGRLGRCWKPASFHVAPSTSLASFGGFIWVKIKPGAPVLVHVSSYQGVILEYLFFTVHGRFGRANAWRASGTPTIQPVSLVRFYQPEDVHGAFDGMFRDSYAAWLESDEKGCALGSYREWLQNPAKETLE